MASSRIIPVRVVSPARGCDCRVCPYFTGNPNAVEAICSGRNSDCAYCGCARSNGPLDISAIVGRVAPCGQCSIRCGSRVDITDWMADVGGTLGFDDIDPGRYRFPSLGRFVPMLDGTSTAAALDGDLRWPAYALGLRRMISLATGQVMPVWRDRTAREVLGLSEAGVSGSGQLTVLVGYGTDPLVELLWTRRRQLEFGSVLAGQGWDLVLAPNFSMYGNQPRTEHLLNFRRNLLIAAELAGEGVPAVPNLYWFRLEDLDRILGWITDTVPVAVAVNLQTFRTDPDWQTTALPGLTYLAMGLDDAGVSTRVVLNGASRADRIATLVALFGERCVFVSQNPVQYARHGAVMGARGREDKHLPVADAFTETVRFYASLINDLIAAGDGESVIGSQVE